MPKNILHGLGRVMTQACIIFTCLVLLVFLIGSAVPTFGNAIELRNILVIFLFSILFAAANLLLRIEKMAIVLRVLAHFAATALGFYVVFILIAAKATAPSAVFVMLLFYTIVYAILMGVYLFLFRTISQTKEEKKTIYERIYK